MAVGGAAVLPVVVLMIVLGWPECLVYGGVFRCLDGCRSQECVDLMAAAAQQCHHVLRSVFLQVGGVEDAAQVLRAYVRALTVQLGRVVYLEEELAKFLV